MRNLKSIYYAFYASAITALLLVMFTAFPYWLPMTLFIIGFIVHWQHNIKMNAANKQYENSLYDRYAPELKRDFVSDGAHVLEIIDKYKIKYPEHITLFTDKLSALKTYYIGVRGDPLPSSLIYALLRDFEQLGKFSKLQDQESKVNARAILNRFEDMGHWTDVARSELSQEELDKARDELRREMAVSQQGHSNTN